MKQLNDRSDVDAVLTVALAVVYKHSHRCGVSLEAFYEVAAFVESDDVPVYMLDVVGKRAVSQYFAEQTATVHHSPQVIILQQGRCAWHASHHRVTAAALKREIDALRAPG